MQKSFRLDEVFKVDYPLSRKNTKLKKGNQIHCGANGCIEESQHELDKKLLATSIL